jgi:hypothetical protein
MVKAVYVLVWLKMLGKLISLVYNRKINKILEYYLKNETLGWGGLVAVMLWPKKKKKEIEFYKFIYKYFYFILLRIRNFRISESELQHVSYIDVNPPEECQK